MKLICATGNNGKFATGYETLATYGIELIQHPLEVDEIQGSDIERTLERKARDAYDQVRQPLVVTDDWWKIIALNGFPGPYMKDVSSEWFTPNKFLKLLEGEKDRTVIQVKNLAYTDGKHVAHFIHASTGQVITEPRGPVDADPWTQVCVMDGYEGKTVAEVLELRKTGKLENVENRPTTVVWTKLAKWLLEQH